MQETTELENDLAGQGYASGIFNLLFLVQRQLSIAFNDGLIQEDPLFRQLFKKVYKTLYRLELEFL